MPAATNTTYTCCS